MGNSFGKSMMHRLSDNTIRDLIFWMNEWVRNSLFENRDFLRMNSLRMVGVERFELPTSCSQSLQQGKTGILGNFVFATFSKNIKQLTLAGCQSEIPLNSSRFRMNRKFCYQSATKFSTLSRIGVEVYFTRKLEVSDFSGTVGNYLEDHRGNLHQNWWLQNYW